MVGGGAGTTIGLRDNLEETKACEEGRRVEMLL